MFTRFKKEKHPIPAPRPPSMMRHAAWRVGTFLLTTMLHVIVGEIMVWAAVKYHVVEIAVKIIT